MAKVQRSCASISDLCCFVSPSFMGLGCAHTPPTGNRSRSSADSLGLEQRLSPGMAHIERCCHRHLEDRRFLPLCSLSAKKRLLSINCAYHSPLFQGLIVILFASQGSASRSWRSDRRPSTACRPCCGRDASATSCGRCPSNCSRAMSKKIRCRWCGPARDILADRVPHGLMAERQARCAPWNRRYRDSRALPGVLHDKAFHRHLVHLIDHTGGDLTGFPVFRADRGYLADCTTPRAEFLARMLVALKPAEKGLACLDRTGKRQRLGFRRLPEPAQHESCGLLRNARLTVQARRGNAGQI